MDWRNVAGLGQVVRGARHRGRLHADRLSDAVLGRNQAHFLHIGKTGGTALRTALTPYRIQTRRGTFRIHFHDHSRTLQDVPVGEAVFFAVRDPVTRFVSGFNSRLRQGRPRYWTPWSSDEEHAFARFRTPQALALALSSPDNATRRAADAAMRSVGFISSSYWNWFGDEDSFAARRGDVLFILFQEQLAADFAILVRLLRIPDRVELPSDEVAMHSTPCGFDQNLSDPAIENLRRWYAKDVEFIRLCRELRQDQTLANDLW